LRGPPRTALPPMTSINHDLLQPSLQRAATGTGQAALAWSRDMLGARGGELLRRALALAFFAATALWLHRREHRMADLMGLQRPNGWVMGLLLIVAGNVLAFLLRAGMKVAE
jgi:hypothetical protein